MSGVEILGLVLGAIPLLVSAFEHFKDACTARDILFHFEQTYGRTLRNVKDEELFFRLHLKKLLLPLIKESLAADPNDLDTLLLDPGGAGWKHKDVEDMIKRRLGEGYGRYMEILKAVTDNLHKLLTALRFTFNPFQERLNAMQAAEASSTMSSRLRLKLNANVRFRRRQLNYAASKWDRDMLVQELHENIEKMGKILNGSDEVAVLEQPSTIVISGHAIRSLLQHWQHANRLYDLIFKSCPCRQSHCAHLWLQHHNSPTFELKLLVFFSSSPSLGRLHSPWKQCGLHFQCIDQLPNYNPRAGLQLGEAADSKSATTASLGSDGHSVGDNCPPKKRQPLSEVQRSIHFFMNAPARSHPAMLTSKDVVTNDNAKRARFTEEVGSASTQPIVEIQDLCKSLADCGMEALCVGALTAHEQSYSYRYKVSSQPEQKIVADEISLYDMLSPKHRPRVGRAERFEIALKIASSHLKIHSTPWARKRWDSTNIKFPYTTEQSRRQILTDRPFIATDFHEGTASDDHNECPIIKSFVYLGIMLLELLFNTVLEEHELWQQFGHENSKHPLFRLMVASQWAQDVEEEQGADFSTIVMWCLNESPLTLEDDDWRKDLADRVVLPLEKCCEWVGPIKDDLLEHAVGTKT